MKKYASYDPDYDDFTLFDLECLDWLYEKSEDVFKERENIDRKTGFKDIHVLIKFATRADQTFELEIDGETEMKTDDTAGFFVFKDNRPDLDQNEARHGFLKSAPPTTATCTLFESLTSNELEEMKELVVEQTKVGQTPTVTDSQCFSYFFIVIIQATCVYISNFLSADNFVLISKFRMNYQLGYNYVSLHCETKVENLCFVRDT